MGVFFPHLIPHHWAARDAETIRRWKPRVVKVVWSGTPPYLDQLPAGSVIVVRDYPLSENYGRRGFVDRADAQQKGVAHADAAKKIADDIRAQYGISPNVLKFEGLNEPRLWSDEPPALTAAYYASFLKRLHRHGLNGVALNLSVGWPGNKGEGLPPEWGPLWEVRDAMQEGDWLGLHEYWGYNGPQDGFLWLAGRYLQCPWPVPILLSEVGIDQAVVDGKHGGWQNLSGDKVSAYLNQLAWYGAQLRADSRIVGACLFTYDLGSKEWETFDIRQDDFLNRFLATAATLGDEPVWGAATVWRWRPLIEKHARQYGIDPRVVAAVIHLESGGNPRAVSSAGAVGLMQVMPAERIPGRPKEELLFTPDINIKTGCDILNTNLAYFNDDLAKALAAYYMGIVGVETKGLKHPKAMEYLTAFEKAWRLLWKDAPIPWHGPVSVPAGDNPPAQPPSLPVVDARWNAEEAVREIEAALDGLNAAQRRLQAARQRLLEKTIPALYRLER